MSNNKGKKANEPMSYAEAAARGVPYHAPSTYQTPAPIYTHGHNTGPQYGQATPMYPAHQAAMNKLFIRPDGTIRPGPYPPAYLPPASHGYYPPHLRIQA